MINDVNEQMAAPVGNSACTRNEYLMLHIRVFLLDDRVSDLVRRKHVRYCDSHNCDHTLRRIHVGL